MNTSGNMIGHRLIEGLSAMGTLQTNPAYSQMFGLGDSAEEPIRGPSTAVDMKEFMQSMQEEEGPVIDTTQTSMTKLPLIGRIHFVREMQGILQVSVTAFYWVYGMFATYGVILYPHFVDGQIKGGLLVVYAIVGALCISALWRACTANPGRVYAYMADQASIDDPEWTWCKVCRFRRPPRAHHCRRCNHCVLRMDHHCPWINNCVGEDNHYLFLQLVYYAFTLSVLTLVIDFVHIYHIPHCKSCDPTAFLVAHDKAFTYVSIGMSVLMACGAVGLVVMHHIGFMMDMTTIDWMKIQKDINEKGMGPHIAVPTVKKNCCRAYTDMCGTRNCLLWPFPCLRKTRNSLSSKPCIA